MTWTREQPTQPGWYWWRAKGQSQPLIARVFETNEGGLMVQFDNGHIEYVRRLVAEAKDLEWAGPLVEPGG